MNSDVATHFHLASIMQSRSVGSYRRIVKMMQVGCIFYVCELFTLH